MEEYKSNSHRSKTEQQPTASDKKIQKVVSGPVRVKKKGEMQKFAGALFSDDFASAKSDILMDLIVPAVKDVIIESVKRILWGEAGYDRKRSAPASKVNYGAFSKEPVRRDVGGVRSGSGFDYDNIIFDNRGDAEAVLNAMDEMIANYEMVSIGDMYEFAEVSTTNYMVHRYGWYNIQSAQVVRVRDGYMIKLPKPQLLN